MSWCAIPFNYRKVCSDIKLFNNTKIYEENIESIIYHVINSVEHKDVISITKTCEIKVVQELFFSSDIEYTYNIDYNKIIKLLWWLPNNPKETLMSKFYKPLE